VSRLQRAEVGAKSDVLRILKGIEALFPPRAMDQLAHFLKIAFFLKIKVLEPH
jgi:hypothetical protein